MEQPRETWVTFAHAADLAHCSLQLVNQLVTQGLLEVRTVPNPHGSTYRPMRLIQYEELAHWLASHPGAKTSRVTAVGAQSLKLRHVASRLRRLDDQRPWISLLLILLHWEEDPEVTANTVSRVLPSLWEATARSQRCWYPAEDGHTLIHCTFPGIGYAQWMSSWQPPDASTPIDLPLQTAGVFYGRFVGPKEPARYPPSVVQQDLKNALVAFQPRWF